MEGKEPQVGSWVTVRSNGRGKRALESIILSWYIPINMPGWGY